MLVEKVLFFKSFLQFNFVVKFMPKEKQLFSRLDIRLGREVRQVFSPPYNEFFLSKNKILTQKTVVCRNG
jgi:hypothetical protein